MLLRDLTPVSRSRGTIRWNAADFEFGSSRSTCSVTLSMKEVSERRRFLDELVPDFRLSTN
ncbi:MAG: hypothetical protein R2845_06360 [Thermomicrobiales bacterium]